MVSSTTFSFLLTTFIIIIESLSHHPVYLASSIRINFYVFSGTRKEKGKKSHHSIKHTSFIYIARRSSSYSSNQSKTKPEDLEEKYKKRNKSNWTQERKREKVI